MNTVKSAVGLGNDNKKDDVAGEEPVSGEQGEGTTAAPFDGGNNAEAQESAKERPEQQDSKEAATTDDNKASTSSGGGGWLKAVNPFGGGSKKKEAETTDTSAGAEQTVSTSQQDESKLPANHLGVNVPAGHSLDFAPPQAPEAAPTETKKMAENNDADRSIASASTDAKDSGFGQPGQLSADWQSKNAGQKTQQLRGSRASMSAPSGQRIFNPAGQGRIPTAGGQTVGARASEDRRRRSVWSNTDEGSSSMPPLDKQGSPDPVTQENTMANTVPQSNNGEGSSKAAEAAAAPAPPSDAPAPEEKPDFQTFQWGEGAESAAPTAGAATATGGTKETNEADAVNGNNKSSTMDQAEKVKEKVKDAVPTPSSGQKKERRGSRLEAFKGKLGLGKKD